MKSVLASARYLLIALLALPAAGCVGCTVTVETPDWDDWGQELERQLYLQFAGPAVLTSAVGRPRRRVVGAGSTRSGWN